MDPATMLGSRLTQLGLASDIERIERTQGALVARRRATEALFTRQHHAGRIQRRREHVTI